MNVVNVFLVLAAPPAAGLVFILARKIRRDRRRSAFYRAVQAAGHPEPRLRTTPEKTGGRTGHDYHH